MRKGKGKGNIKRRLAIASVVAITGLGATATAANAAEDQSCSWASGRGYVCTTVGHSGTYVNYVWAIRSKTDPWPWAICNSSAWVYYVPPWGGAYGLAYEQNGGCVYITARYKLNVNRYVPSGSRVCSKFSEDGRPVGPEPCVTVW